LNTWLIRLYVVVFGDHFLLFKSCDLSYCLCATWLRLYLI